MNRRGFVGRILGSLIGFFGLHSSTEEDRKEKSIAPCSPDAELIAYRVKSSRFWDTDGKERFTTVAWGRYEMKPTWDKVRRDFLLPAPEGFVLYHRHWHGVSMDERDVEVELNYEKDE
jgi:hypothetical protein